MLLVRHTKKASHLTNSYGLPAGHIYKNESLRETCVREIEEETGLKIEQKNFKNFTSHLLFENTKKEQKGSLLYTCLLHRPFKEKLKQLHETIPEWVDPSKLDEMNILGNLKDVIEEFWAEYKQS